MEEVRALELLASASSTFQAVVSNPPYQVEVAKDTMAEQKTVMNVFHRHQEVADAIAVRTCFIYPGERWINRSGKGMREFGEAQVNSPALARVVFWPDSTEVFTAIRLGDGAAVALKDFTRPADAATWTLDYRKGKDDLYVEVPIAHPGAAPIAMDPRVQAIVSKTLRQADAWGQARLAGRTTAQKTFAIESNFVALNPELVRPEAEPPPREALPEYCRIFTNDAAGKGGRAQWFWLRRDAVPTNRHYIDQWKIIVSSMNPVGARGTGHSPLATLLGPGEIFGRSRIGVAIFATELEARNFFRAFQTDFYRFHYACLGDSQTLLGMNAPDLGDYASSDLVDLTLPPEDLNDELCRAYGLTGEEQAFMAAWVSRLAPLVKAPAQDEEC